jgi:hypothetical protein
MRLTYMFRLTQPPCQVTMKTMKYKTPRYSISASWYFVQEPIEECEWSVLANGT